MRVPDVSRRRLLKTGAALGILGSLPVNASTVAAQSSPTLDKWLQPLPSPAVKQPSGKRNGADYYNFSIEEVEQELHPDLPKTTVWGYDGSYPGPTVEARRNRQVKVEFDNSSLDANDHLLNVDRRVHGTKPGDYDNYDGTVPAVRTTTHAHGLHVEPESDGLPEAWIAPDDTRGPRREKDVLDYPNRQPAATLFYHDHALGITRLNVYAGLAGFYLVRSTQADQLNLPDGDQEVPVLIQDRTFKDDGSGDLFYPTNFAAEFGGDTAVVNGAVWPYLEVEPRRYRFRFLNGSNGRTFNLSLKNETTTANDVPTVYQIGVDLGFLPEVVAIRPGSNTDLDSLTLAPAERGDVIVDFSDHAGDTITVMNDAEFPYTGTNSGVGSEFAEMAEILQFQVKDIEEPADDSAEPTELDLPADAEFREEAARQTRNMTLDSPAEPVNGLDTHLLNDSLWNDPEAVVEPQLGTTEIWRLANTTGDTHPIHVHLVEFQVLDRQGFNADDFKTARNNGENPSVEDYLVGEPQPPYPNEAGEKDTVRVNPDEAVRLISRFGDFTGRYVWHCHILEHEDQEMMLPYRVVKGGN